MQHVKFSAYVPDSQRDKPNVQVAIRELIWLAGGSTAIAASGTYLSQGDTIVEPVTVHEYLIENTGSTIDDHRLRVFRGSLARLVLALKRGGEQSVLIEESAIIARFS